MIIGVVAVVIVEYESESEFESFVIILMLLTVIAVVIIGVIGGSCYIVIVTGCEDYCCIDGSCDNLR